jgi:PAS domain S-box-containing protein
MTDTLIVLNEDLTIRSCNQAAMSRLDYDEHALSGKHFSKVLQIDDVERVFEFVEKEGHFVEDQGVCYLSKSGASIPVIFSASTLEDKRKGYVCIAHDIGDLIRAQRELQETNTKLRKMNLEVKEVQAQLVQSAKLASVGELATGVAHELNQPLNIMSLNANLVLNDCKGQRYNEVEGFCNLVMDQVRRANEIINHLRTFGREADLIHKQLTPIEKIVHDSFIMLREQLKLANINVEKKIEENLPSVYCNPIQIEQVLTNLIVNARDALEGSNNKQIKVSAECDGDNLVISVADNGSGIPEDILGRIFDPFMTTKEVGKGTGLGLSISHGLIKDHKGKIEVESTFERGTTFKIYLPIESDVDQSE